MKSLVSHHSAHQDTVVGPMNFYLQRGGPGRDSGGGNSPRKVGEYGADTMQNYIGTMPFFPDCAFWSFCDAFGKPRAF